MKEVSYLEINPRAKSIEVLFAKFSSHERKFSQVIRKLGILYLSIRNPNSLLTKLTILTYLLNLLDLTTFLTVKGKRFFFQNALGTSLVKKKSLHVFSTFYINRPLTALFLCKRCTKYENISHWSNKNYYSNL